MINGKSMTVVCSSEIKINSVKYAFLFLLASSFLLNLVGYGFAYMYMAALPLVFACLEKKHLFASLFFLSLMVVCQVVSLHLNGFLNYAAAKDVIYFSLFVVSVCGIRKLQVSEGEKLNIASIWAVFFILNILLGVLGYGYTSYGNKMASESHEFSNAIGIKGVYYSANELSYIGGIISMALLHLEAYKKLSGLFLIVLMQVSLVAVSTKSAYLTAAIIIIFVVFKVLSVKSFIKILPVLLLTFYVFGDFAYSKYIDFSERFYYFYEKEGLVGALLSGRFERVDSLINGISPIGVLLGSSNVSGWVNYENDLLNLFANGGIFGVLMLVYFFYSLLPGKHVSLVFMMMVFYTFCYSVFVGHVLFYSGTLISVLMFLLVYGRGRHV